MLLASFQNSYNYITVPTSNVWERSLFSTSLPAIDMIVLFNFRQSDRCKNIPHCYFNLDFCDYQRTEYILCHLHMPFYELYFDIICSVYCDLVFLSIYNFSLCSNGIDTLSTIWITNIFMAVLYVYYLCPLFFARMHKVNFLLR